MNEVFGRYQLVEKIAQGGMAEILLARHLSGTKHSCALKRILPEFSRDLQFVSMFIDEARIIIGLNHPNIVQLYDFGQVDNTYFMAIEYVDGTDLAALLRNHVNQGQALPPIVASWIVREILAGLGHAHELTDAQGRSLRVVHRDVSPQNVLVSTSGQVKITDFGIAAARHKLTSTSPGMVRGKAAYMAPEQAQGFAVDATTDLWAAGVILWEALAGSRLFAEDNPVATLLRVLGDDVIPPSGLRPGIPSSLDDVIFGLLQRDRTRRTHGADVAVTALDLVITELAQRSPLAKNGAFDERCLADWLRNVHWSQDTAPMRPAALSHRAPPVSPVEVTMRTVHKLSDDANLEAALREFQREQDPWILVDVGDRAVSLGLPDVALSAWRTAAAAFAFRGLLIQALCAYAGVRRLCNDADVAADVAALAELSPGERDELDKLVTRFDRHDFARFIARDELPLQRPVPLLGSLGPRELAELSNVVSIRRVSKGDVILREGEPGDVLYAVGRGRFVVSCSSGGDSTSVPPAAAELDWIESTANETGVPIEQLVQPQRAERIYLAALADGDFFGEFSFLAERPRSATVEAVTDGVLLEIERQDVEHIAAVDPGFTAPLLNFYKERVVELMMAKSPVFSLLSPADRKALLDTAVMLEVEDGDVIVAEGTRNDDLFFIKRGEVEVFRLDPNDISIFINKLGAGQFFGEVAALRKTPRTVSVRAIGRVSLFQIQGQALSAIVDRDARLDALFEAMIQTRTRETQARVLEHTRLFFGT